MSGCYLRVRGANLDGPGVAATLSVAVDKRWRRGDQRSPKSTFETGGLQFRVSEHDGSHVADQISDALAFLTLHRDVLLELQQRSDVDELYLDFAWDIPAAAAARWNRWPPELCRICGELRIGIEATVYLFEHDRSIGA